jgi:hypothetical protein
MRVTDYSLAERWGQLSLPLAVVSPQIAEEILAARPSLDVPEGFDWSDEDLVVMREGVLVSALTSLASGHTGSASRQESMEWLDSEELEPFSFNICALATGRDPEILRSAIHRALEEKNANVKRPLAA